MNSKVKVTLISSITAIITTIVGFLGGMQITNSRINNQVTTIIGDNNNIEVNNIEELVRDYQKLQNENESLRGQNTAYYDELTKLQEKTDLKSNEYENNVKQMSDEIDRLKKEIEEYPDIQFKDLALSVDGNSIPINTLNSSAIINNQTYYSADLLNSILPKNTNITIRDGTMYMGKIIKDKASLLDQWIVDRNNVDVNINAVDSYGNTHANVLCLYYNSYIIFNLNGEYSNIRFSLAISEKAEINRNGTITIKADDKVVYISPKLTKTTQPFDVVDIPINNCMLLTIEYDVNNNYCIFSDAVVYN